MSKKIIFLLICFLALGLSATEIRLKGKNGVERTFDVIAVSANNIFYLEKNKTKKMSFNLLDENCLKQYPQIQKLREKSKQFSEMCLKGEESYDYSKVSPKKHIQKEGNRYAVRSSLWSVGGGSLPVANYTEEEYSKEKNKVISIFGTFFDETRNDAIIISAKVKVDKNMYGNKIPPVEKIQDFAVLNLPPKKYKKGDKISAIIVPTRSKSYYICISQSNFDEAIKDIILPIFDYHFE